MLFSTAAVRWIGRAVGLGLCLQLLTAVSVSAAPSLAERLGFSASDRILIVNGDDVGMCHAANAGTIECLEKGLMRSSTILVPCPWFNEIAEYARTHPEKDFGIHLTQTSEWRFYRWGPVLAKERVPSLVDREGYLWRSVPEVYASAKLEEVLEESRAQIRKALAAGVDVTHLDSHMGTLQLRLDYMEIYLQLAVEFNLPVRMASQSTLAGLGHPQLRARFADKGIVFPDYFVYEELKEMPKAVKAFWMNTVKNIKPGVTELYIHAAKPTDELRAITGSWKTRGEEYETFANDPDMRRLVEEQGIKLIGYRPLRELQRKMGAKPGP